MQLYNTFKRSRRHKERIFQRPTHLQREAYANCASLMPSRGIASRAVNRRPVGSVARNPQTLILHAWRCYRSLLVYVAKGVAWRAHRAGCVTGGFLFFFSLCVFFDCRGDSHTVNRSSKNANFISVS